MQGDDYVRTHLICNGSLMKDRWRDFLMWKFNSDFDELFSQITHTDQDWAASWGSDWHAVDGLGFDDLLKPALSEVEVKDVPPAVIELHQKPAEAILPELAPEADPKEPGEAIAAEIIPDPAPQEPAEATSPELAPEPAPQEPTEATVPELIPEPAPIVGEKPHDTERILSILRHKGLLTKTGPLKECTAKPLVIDLTGPKPVTSEIPSSQPKAAEHLSQRMMMSL